MPNFLVNVAVAVLKTVGMKAAAVAAIGQTGLAVIGGSILVGGALVAKKVMGLFEIQMPKIDTDASRQSTNKGTTEPHKIIYGETLVSGPVVFVATAGTDNKDLYYAVALAGHEVEDITDIHFDNEVIADADIAATTSTASTSGAVSGSGTFGPKGSPSTTICHVNKHLGTATQAADSLLRAAKPSKWTTAHQGKGIAYIVTKWVLNDDSAETWDKFTPNNIKAVVKGRKIYDPRLDSTQTDISGSGSHRLADSTTWAYSTNPALAVADYLMNADFGLGVSSSKIDWAAIKTAADGCDVSVSVPGGTQSRFTCNGVLFGTDSHKTNINKLLSAMNGSIAYIDGYYVVKAGIHENPVVDLDEDDLSGSISIKTSLERGDRFNTVKGVFIDPASNYKSTEFPKVQLSTAYNRDNDEELHKEIALNMTNSSFMAQRIAHKLIQQSDLQKIITYPTNMKGLRVAVGDRVRVTNTELSWTLKEFQCVQWSFNEEGGVTLLLREENSAKYADPTVTPNNEYSTITSDGVLEDAFRGVPTPSGLRVVSGEGKVFLDWVNPGNPQEFQTVHVFVSTDNNLSNAVKCGETDGSQFVHDSAASAGDATEYAVGDTRYYWVRAVNFVGTSNEARSSAHGSQSVTVLATAVTWSNVANPTIGIQLDTDDSIEIVYNAETQTSGSAIATSGIEEDVTITQGGITMSNGGAIRGGQTAFNSGTGFFLGHDSSAYKFSIGNSGGEKLTFDGSNLSVTGAVNASSGDFSGQVAVGSTAGTITVIDGNDTDYRLFTNATLDTDTNQYLPDDSSFKVGNDGRVFASNITIYNDNGDVLLSPSGLGAAALNDISTTSGQVVSTVGGTVSNSTSEITLTTSSASESFTITSKVAINDNYDGTQYFSGASTSSTANAEAQLTGVDVLIDYYVKADGGSYGASPDVTKTVTIVNSGTPTSTQMRVGGFDRGASYSGSLTRYFAVLQDFGGALEIIPNSGGGASSYVVTTASLGSSLFPSAQTYKIKIVMRVVEDGTTTVISGSTTPPSSDNTTTGIYFDGGNSDERHYEITGTGLIKNSDNNFTSGSQNLLSSGGTISGNLVVTGDFTVQGTTTTIETANLNVEDKNITLNYGTGDTSANADGAGITIQDAVNSSTDATLLWSATNDRFDFSHNVEFSGSNQYYTGTTNYHRSDSYFAFLTLNGNAQAARFKSVAAQTSYANSASEGMFNALNGYAVGTGTGTTIIDGSGNITSPSHTINGGTTFIPFQISGSSTTYTSMSIANTSSGDAIIWFDASNGDLSGSDYASIRQNNGLDLVLRTESSASEIIFQPAGSTALTLNTDQSATFAGTITTQGAGDIIIEDTGGGSAHLRLKSSSSGTVSSHWKLKTNSANHFYIDNDTQGTSPVTINSNGNVDLSGRLQIATSSPVFIINDNDATNATNQVGYISWQRQGVEKSWIGYGSSGNDRFSIQNTEGELTIYPNVVISNSSPQLMFETGSSHYNWQIAAQESLNAAFEIGYGSVDGDATNDSFTTVFTTTQGGTTTLSNNQDISMDANGAGQLVIKGNGYNGAIALDGTAMHIYHNSVSRDLILGVNETEALRIHGSTKQVQLRGHGQEALKIRSTGGTGYTQGSILIESGTTDSPQGRGQGVYMFNEGQDRTWYAGTLYTAGATYGIGHASGTTFQPSAASASNVAMSINTSNQTTFGSTVFINGTSDNQLFLNSNSTSANTGLFFRENGSDKWELYHRGSDKNFTLYSYVAGQITAAFHDDGRLELQGPPASYSALRMGGTANTNYTHMMFTTNSGTGEIWKSGTTYSSYGGASALNIYNSNANIAFFPHGVTTAQLNLANGTSTFDGAVSITHTNLSSEPYSGLQIDNTSTSGAAYTGVTSDAVFQTHYRFKLNGALKWQARVGAGAGIDDFRIYSWTAGADILAIKNNRRVGINELDPSTALTVSGDFNATTAGSKPSITGTGIYGGGIGFIDTNVSGIYTDTAGANLKFFTNQSSTDTAASKVAMTINGSANVGIGGNHTPLGLLHIKGTGDAIRVESTNTGSGGAQMDLLHFTTSPADNDIHGSINFGGYHSGTNSSYGSSIRSVWTDVSLRKAELQFYTRSSGNFDERMRIDDDKVQFVEPIQADDGIRAWTDSGTKFYTHLATGSFYNTTGYIVINTQIPGHNQSGNANMFSFRVQGFWYDANAGGIIDFVVGCYAGENNFYNRSYVGSIPDAWSGAVAFYTDNNGKVALVLGSGSTSQKCEISVTDFTQGYLNVNTSYAQNWSTQVTTSLSGYTNGQSVSPRNRLEKLRGNTTIESGNLGINATASSTYPLYLESSQRYLIGMRNTSADASYPWLAHDTSASQSRFIVHFNGVGDKFSVREDGFTQIAGNVQVGDSSNSRHVRAYHNDGAYMTLEGYGLIMNRAASYIRPTTGGNKTLYIGNADDSLDWADVIVRSDRGMHVHGNLEIGENNAIYRVGHLAVAGSSTGAIVIQLPGSRNANYSMATFRITTYEYNSKAQNVYHVSGHDWTSGWYNTGADHHGFSTAEHVYLADNTTTNKQAIIIGSTSESRSYLTVTVDVISAPHFYRNNMDFHAGVTMSLETSLTNWSLGGSRVRSSLRTQIGQKEYYELGQYGRIYGGSTAYISLYSSAYLTIQGSHGNATIGAGNSSYCHIQTDRPRFYFNKHLVVDQGIISSYNEDLILRRAQDSAYQMTLSTSGATFTHNVTAYSDERLKEDIKAIPSADALDTVKKLEGVTYRRIDNQEENIGFIAQQIERDCPEIADRVVGEMDDERKTKHVNYANMVALLTSAMQEQQKTIDALTKRIEELENGSNKKHDD